MGPWLRRSKARAFRAGAGGFFGSGSLPGCPVLPITRLSSDRRRFNFAQPFLPSTGATLTFWFILSTPAIGAMTAIRTGNSTAVNPLSYILLLKDEKFVPRFAQHLVQCR